LSKALTEKFPQLILAGAEAPPFRPLTEEEDDQVVQRINDSGARLIFIGLGCPKQDIFSYEHRDRLNGFQICVGAAFDFHAGAKPMAPQWMQSNGLEWMFRLYKEPGRLWKRYLCTNSLFVWKVAIAIVFGKNRRRW
jgi:exopolysaccharide biosynthesis WecB/TagA/CpsF family protein